MLSRHRIRAALADDVHLRRAYDRRVIEKIRENYSSFIDAVARKEVLLADVMEQIHSADEDIPMELVRSVIAAADNP